MCKYCESVANYLTVIETDDRIFVGLNGGYLQIFDEEYPGFVENVSINYCPICGRNLKGETRND